MRVDKISAARRRKHLANASPNVFVRWSHERTQYEGVIEVYDNRTGDKIEIIADQLVWESIHKKLREMFEKEAHA